MTRIDWLEVRLFFVRLFSFLSNHARSQKFAMGGGFFGVWRQAPSLRRPMGVWGQSYPGAGDTGVFGKEPPALEKCAFFCKNNLILGVFNKNNIFKTWHRNWQGNMIQLVALMGYVILITLFSFLVYILENHEILLFNKTLTE